MLLSSLRRAITPVAAALATAWIGVVLIGAAAYPARADQVRAREWWLQALHVTRAWATSQGAGVTVAVLDPGADPAVADLRGSVRAGPDLTGSGRHLGGPYWGTHGTAMASLIAGHGHGRGNRDGIAGVAPRASILSIRVIMEAGDPLRADPKIAARQPAAIAAGVKYAADHGVQVIALPLDPEGRTAGGRPAERSAIAYALAKGVTLVAPAGDDGAGADIVNYPAAYRGVISVGAFDSNTVNAPFTSRRSYVTLIAAGAGVVAATPSGGYALFNSTSAASAVVAGMAALIKSRFPALTPAQVADALRHGTGFHRRGGKLDGSGYGTADATRALALAAVIQTAAMTGAPSQPQTPGHGHTPATLAAQPAASPVAASFSSTLVSEATVLFVVLLVVLLALSVIAVVRAPGLAARPPAEDLDEASDAAAPQLIPGYPAGPPGQFRPPLPSRRTGRPEPGQYAQGQPSYADTPPGPSPARPGAPYQAPGASGRTGPRDQEYSGQPGYPGYGARPAQGQVPWQGAIRPPNVASEPPWGPAPKPEGEPPPPSSRPAPPPPPQRRRA